jgi:hypothetical protein
MRRPRCEPCLHFVLSFRRALPYNLRFAFDGDERMTMSWKNTIIGLSLGLAACGGGSSPAAPGPTPSTTLAAKPTPTPAATPTPVVGFSCYLPSQSEDGSKCAPSSKSAAYFYPQVKGAIDQVIADRPNWFETDKFGVQVKAPQKFINALVDTLGQKYGLCATQGGPKDEIAVKNRNSFSEQYDVIAQNKYGVNYVIWSYTVTCTPARF